MSRKLNAKSLGGAEYFLTFIDDKTRFTWVYLLKRKDEVFQRFVEWKAMVENSGGGKLKVLRSDNGGEYMAKRFQEYLKAEGVRHEVTVPKTSQKNGVAECLNRTLMEMVRTMLIESKLDQRFWGEAMSTAVYLRNRSSIKAVIGMTPHEALYGEKPNMRHLRALGCASYPLIMKDGSLRVMCSRHSILAFENTFPCISHLNVLTLWVATTHIGRVHYRNQLHDCSMIQVFWNSGKQG